jgi:invasion protein IalB
MNRHGLRDCLRIPMGRDAGDFLLPARSEAARRCRTHRKRRATLSGGENRRVPNGLGVKGPSGSSRRLADALKASPAPSLLPFGPFTPNAAPMRILKQSLMGGMCLALATGAAGALAQARSDWAVECPTDGNIVCTAKTQMSYRPGTMMVVASKTFTVSVRDDPAKPLVSMKLSDTEVRYAQLRLDRPVKMNDMICDGVDCTMSYADARATIEALKSGRQAAILLFTNNGQVLQVGISTDGFAEAVARTRPQ